MQCKPISTLSETLHQNLQIAGKDYLLDTPDYNDFESGDNDSYHHRIATITLGAFRKAQLRLWHDGDSHNDGWYVGTVTLQIQFENTSYMALYKRWGDVGWLATDEAPYYTREAILQDGQEV